MCHNKTPQANFVLFISLRTSCVLVLLLFGFVSTHHYETVIDYKKCNTFYRQIIYMYCNIIKQSIIRLLTAETEK